MEDTLWYWTNPLFVNWQGAGQKLPRNKIAAGVPIYGYDFAYGKDPDDLSGQVAPGYKASRYKDILAQFPDAHRAANGNIKVSGSTPRPSFISAPGNYPYTHNIYFETPDMAVKKLNFLKDVGAQGVIIWELSNDVWEDGKSIIKALYQNSGNPINTQAMELSGVNPTPSGVVTKWGEIQEDGCTGYGRKQYSARLWHIQGSWEEACNNTQANIKGQWFDRPTRCVNTGITGMWGEFDVEDDSCGSLTELVAKIKKLIDEGKKVSRHDLDLQEQKIHLDLGGEGYHEKDGVVSGFRTAINLNNKENDSQFQDRKIPHLILVNFDEPYPFADGFADYITIQGAPLFPHNVEEIVRMLRKGGKVGLWIDQNRFQNEIKDLESKLDSKAKQVNKYEDEFGGKAGYEKLLIETLEVHVTPEGPGHEEL